MNDVVQKSSADQETSETLNTKKYQFRFYPPWLEPDENAANEDTGCDQQYTNPDDPTLERGALWISSFTERVFAPARAHTFPSDGTTRHGSTPAPPPPDSHCL